MKRLLLLLCLMPLVVQAEEDKDVKPAFLSTKQGLYAYPGILYKDLGEWVGTDYLYNLPPQLGVVVNVISASGDDLPFKIEQVKQEVMNILDDYRLQPTPVAALGPQALPFFDLLIMIYPIDKGFVAVCDGRLFEKVEVERVELGQDVSLQGITWEKKSLIRASKEDFQEFLDNSVEEIAKAFGERYKVYLRLKEQTEKDNLQ
ncbi:MAG: hypothetical protein KDK65_05895 [Chlamydiia bacterium]|nr:hypothetical protein [Chlamydiia bacterium]